MKLNFEYCRICNAEKYFVNHEDGLNFWCGECYYYFLLNCKSYKNYQRCFPILFQNVSKEEWKDIKKLEVIEFDLSVFNLCPYKLENILDNEK